MLSWRHEQLPGLSCRLRWLTRSAPSCSAALLPGQRCPQHMRPGCAPSSSGACRSQVAAAYQAVSHAGLWVGYIVTCISHCKQQFKYPDKLKYEYAGAERRCDACMSGVQCFIMTTEDSAQPHALCKHQRVSQPCACAIQLLLIHLQHAVLTLQQCTAGSSTTERCRTCERSRMQS